MPGLAPFCLSAGLVWPVKAGEERERRLTGCRAWLSRVEVNSVRVMFHSIRLCISCLAPMLEKQEVNFGMSGKE